jgi:hypothetical protein
MVRVVVTRPNHDYATLCGYTALSVVNEYYFRKGYDIRDLSGSTATRENVLRELPAEMFYGVGHGDADVFTGWGNRTIFYVCDCKELSSSIVYLLSCLTARELGEDIVRKGARAYVGYNEEFAWIVYDRYTCAYDTYNDRYCKWFFTPVRVLLERIADGATVGEANAGSIAEWNFGVSYWTENPENDPNAGLVLYYLVWDRDAQTLLGDFNARLAPTMRLEATVASSYDVRAELYGIVLQATVVSSYADSARLSVSRPRRWYYFLPAIASATYALTQEDAERRRKALLVAGALGVGAYAFIQLTKPKPRPYVPPGIALRATVVSSYEVRATALPPIHLRPEVTSGYAVSAIITPAIRLVASVASGYVDTATATPAIRVEAPETLTSTAEARIELRVSVEAQEYHASTTTAKVELRLSLTASATSSYVDRVDIVRVVAVRPSVVSSYVDGATVGKATAVSASDTLTSTTMATVERRAIGVRPSVVSSYVDTATVSVTSAIRATVTSSYVDSATVGGTFRVTASDTLVSSISATVSTAVLTVAGLETLTSTLSPGGLMVYEGTTVRGVLYTNVDCSKLVSISAVDAYATYGCVDGKVVVYTYDKSVSGEVWSVEPDGTLSHLHTAVPKDTVVRVAYLW